MGNRSLPPSWQPPVGSPTGGRRVSAVLLTAPKAWAAARLCSTPACRPATPALPDAWAAWYRRPCRTRLLARRRVRVGRRARLRPQGDGHHGPGRVGVGAPPLPPPRHRSRPRRLHRRRHRRHVGRRVRQRDAAVGAHPARRRVRPPARVPRSRSRRGRSRSPSAGACSSCRARRGPTTTPRCISAGGGVYARTLKSIPITPEVRARLDLDDGVDALTPAELIRAILLAPVDLLYNGGIGTYVKARAETHAAVGDKANDAVRVDGRRAALPECGRGRQPRLHPGRPGRVRARRRAHQHRRDRQQRGRRHLRPRGQHQDRARRRGARRRAERGRSQRAARRA